MNLSEEFTTLINRISKDIVCRTKKSMIVAEELRSFNKKLAKKNLTRWNSILFMIRSVLRVSQAEYASIRSKMPMKTIAQRKVKNAFQITDKEREMLEVLQHVLVLFEFVTDEFQTNDKISVFIGNIVSAGVGLTLTSSNITVFNSFQWSPGENDQAEYRNYRIGQKNNVSIYFILFEDTISIRIWEMLRDKKRNISTILNENDIITEIIKSKTKALVNISLVSI